MEDGSDLNYFELLVRLKMRMEEEKRGAHVRKKRIKEKEIRD